MSTVAIRAGLRDLTASERDALLDRTRAHPDVSVDVRRLLEDVRARGDDALRDMAARFDGVELDALDVPQRSWRRAADALERNLSAALERARENLRRFHAALRPEPIRIEVEPGVVVTRRWAPLERVGVYAPGGTAAYPSSVLMGVVPALAAGVEDVVVCSPPGPDGAPSPAVQAACEVAGATRLFAIGGAGAVAALSYGTASVPRVDALVGPGNRWVTEAKRQVAGDVRIDSPAGPSEVLILADGSARAATVALEMVAQAEHDPDAAAVLVSTSASLVDEVARALDRLVEGTPRREIVRASLAAAGALVHAHDLDEAVAFARAYAPEHLLVIADDARTLARRVPTAGTVFVGAPSSVVFGDYMTGANHVLPTAGRARSFSGLSTLDFMRSYTVQELTREAAARLAGPTATLASAEGLPAHAAAARERAT